MGQDETPATAPNPATPTQLLFQVAYARYHGLHRGLVVSPHKDTIPLVEPYMHAVGTSLSVAIQDEMASPLPTTHMAWCAVLEGAIRRIMGVGYDIRVHWCGCPGCLSQQTEAHPGSVAPGRAAN